MAAGINLSDPNLGPFTFSDETTRTRTLDATINHQSGNNSITFSGRVGQDEGSSDEDFFEANLSWSRPLNRSTSVSADAGYERSEFKDEDRNDNTYTAGASLSYQLWSNVNSSLSYNFEKRQSSDGDDSFTENSITLSATISF